MKYPVIVAPFINADGMALYPFILVKRASLKTDQSLIRHETIHLKQAAETLVVPFYVLYLLFYLAGLIKYRSHNRAYMNIAFEREAYANERNIAYLQHRKLWAWLRYF